MEARLLGQLRRQVYVMSTADQPVTIFGNFIETTADRVASSEAGTAEIIVEDMDVYFASLEAPALAQRDLRELLDEGFKDLTAFRVDRGAEIEHMVVGRLVRRNLWFGVKHRQKMRSWKQAD